MKQEVHLDGRDAVVITYTIRRRQLETSSKSQLVRSMARMLRILFDKMQPIVRFKDDDQPDDYINDSVIRAVLDDAYDDHWAVHSEMCGTVCNCKQQAEIIAEARRRIANLERLR